MQSTLRETLRSAQQDYAEAGLKASQQFNIIRDLKNSHVDDENDQDAARELRRPLQELFAELRLECDDLGNTTRHS